MTDDPEGTMRDDEPGTGGGGRAGPREASAGRRADGGRPGPWGRGEHGHEQIHARPWSAGREHGGPPWAAAGHGRGGPWGGMRPGGPRGRFMRRIGCVFGIVFLLVLVGAASLVGLVATWLGLIAPQPGGGPGPLAIGLVVLLVVVVVMGLTRLGTGLRGLAAPIADLVDAARGIEAGDLTVRVVERPRVPGDLRRLTAAFNTMAERLEIDEAQRRTLLADVSHELRTPLSVVRGNLEAIQDGVHPPDAAHLQAIIDETEVLARLVDDLRTVALAEAGTLPLHREPTDIGVLATDVVAAHRAAADAAGIGLEVATEDAPIVEVDPVRVREVLGNLLANALRYTPAGGIVRVSVAPAADGGVALDVEDTGTGVAPEVLPHIFDRFWKSPDSRGSGLGLAIVRNLVERHGGSVTAESESGRGTTIAIRLPPNGETGAD